MRFGLVLAAMVLLSPQAHASGGFWCDADDAKVVFSILSGVTHGLGNPLFNFRGEMEIRDAAVAEDLRKSAYQIGNLTQHWLDAGELKMQLYRERGGDAPVGEVDLLIVTKATDEATFEGSYTLRVSDMTGVTNGDAKTFEATGKVACGAE